MNECIYLFISSFLHYFMNIKNPCKKVELRARFVVVTTKLVPDSPYRRLIAEYLSFQTAVLKPTKNIFHTFIQWKVLYGSVLWTNLIPKVKFGITDHHLVRNLSVI